MKAFLLAAGEGTRLRPLTNDLPKCLVPIKGKPLLQIWLELCFGHGVDEVLINVHHHSAKVRAFLDSRSFASPPVKIFEEPKLLGSAGTVIANSEWLQDEDWFAVFYADVLTNANLGALFSAHRKHHPLVTIGVTLRENPQECGIVSVDEQGYATTFVEKPTDPKSNLGFSGLMIASTKLLPEMAKISEGLPTCCPVDFGQHVFPNLIGRMRAFPLTGFLADIGTLSRYEMAQSTWRSAEETVSP
jgi:mannose-1-phosphate guanylyltransferase